MSLTRRSSNLDGPSGRIIVPSVDLGSAEFLTALSPKVREGPPYRFSIRFFEHTPARPWRVVLFFRGEFNTIILVQPRVSHPLKRVDFLVFVAGFRVVGCGLMEGRYALVTVFHLAWLGLSCLSVV
jgi:hypothetical protein